MQCKGTKKNTYYNIITLYFYVIYIISVLFNIPPIFRIKTKTRKIGGKTRKIGGKCIFKITRNSLIFNYLQP